MVVSHHVAKVGGLFEKERILIYKIQHKSFKVVLTTVTNNDQASSGGPEKLSHLLTVVSM